MLYLVAGPVVALIGIGAIFFVLRRKSVEKRSMYSARRSQIEHKVRAARQRTLAPRGRADKLPEAPVAPASPFEQTQVQPMVNYDVAAYQAPPSAPPAPPPAAPPPERAWETPAAPQQMPWETGPTEPAAAPESTPAPSFDYPPAPPEPFAPAAEPAPRAEPSEPVWTPAPRPAEPATPIEQPVAAASQSSAGWSIVTTAKDSSIGDESGGKSKGRAAGGSAWQLASGEAPNLETEDDGDAKRPSGTLVAAAQYAVLVVGLVMVLIGVLVMVANSHVT